MTAAIRTCQNCRHWFLHPPVRYVDGEAMGKCTKAQELSKQNFCCGAWEVYTFQIPPKEVKNE